MRNYKRTRIKTLRCRLCKHLFAGEQEPKCSAFPDGIPPLIFSNEIPHFYDYEGQVSNITYEPPDRKRRLKAFWAKDKENIDILFSKREEICKEIEGEARLLFAKIILKETVVRVSKIEIYLNRNVKSWVMKKNCLIVFAEAEPSFLESLDEDSQLLEKLQDLLLIESIKNQKTDIELIIQENGKCDLNIINLNEEERGAKNEIRKKLYVKLNENYLVEKGYRKLTDEELEKEVFEVLKNRPKNNPLYTHQIIEVLRNQKKFIVKEDKVYQLRRRLGYMKDWER